MEVPFSLPWAQNWELFRLILPHLYPIMNRGEPPNQKLGRANNWTRAKIIESPIFQIMIKESIIALWQRAILFTQWSSKRPIIAWGKLRWAMLSAASSRNRYLSQRGRFVSHLSRIPCLQVAIPTTKTFHHSKFSSTKTRICRTGSSTNKSPLTTSRETFQPATNLHTLWVNTSIWLASRQVMKLPVEVLNLQWRSSRFHQR